MKSKLNFNKAVKVFFHSMPKLVTGLALVLCKYLPTCFRIGSKVNVATNWFWLFFLLPLE